MEEWGDMGDSE